MQTALNTTNEDILVDSLDEDFNIEDSELSEELLLSQSIEILNSDDDFYYILSLLKDGKLANYKFESILANLADDLAEESHKLSTTLSNLPKEREKPSSLQDAEYIKRKGKFLTKVYSKEAPLKKADGKPTRYSLASIIWGEPIPKNSADCKRLVEKGESLLAKYEALKSKKPSKEVVKEEATKESIKETLSQDAPALESLPLRLSNGMLRVPIAKKGRWFHDQHGIVEFTEDDFNEIQELSRSDVLGFAPYITYGHPTDMPYESVDAELKKGELKGWEQEDDVLFGLFDSKEDSYNLCLNGDYEFASGEFIRNYKDKFTGDNKGTVLMRVALTNSPFIPFGDAKVQALSNNSLLKSTPFIIKLSTETIPNPIEENKELTNAQEIYRNKSYSRRYT